MAELPNISEEGSSFEPYSIQTTETDRDRTLEQYYDQCQQCETTDEELVLDDFIE